MKIAHLIIALLLGGALRLGAGVIALPDDQITDSNWRTAVPASIDEDRKYGTDGFIVYAWAFGWDDYLINVHSGQLNRMSLRQLPAYIAEVSTDEILWIYGGGTNANYGRLQDPSSPGVTHPATVLHGANATNDDVIRLALRRATRQAFRLTLIIGGGDGGRFVSDTQSIEVNAGSAGSAKTTHTGLPGVGVSYKSFDIDAGTDDIVVTLNGEGNGDRTHLTGLAFDTQGLPPGQCQVKVLASPADGGTVTGGGIYATGTNVTVEASANTGYQFANWAENGIQASDSARYTFAVSNSRTLVASFIQSNALACLPGLRRQIYTDVPGWSIPHLTASPKFPFAPDRVDSVPTFESECPPDDAGNTYDQRLTGWLVPPLTGDYVFYLASDVAGQVFLSTDEVPGNKQLIVQETFWSPWRNWAGTPEKPQRASASILLVAGNHYYLEVLHKSGGDADRVAVAWRLPGGDAPRNGDPPIGGEYLLYRPNMPEALWTTDPLGSGTVKAHPAPPPGGRYTLGTVVTLEAAAAFGYRFNGWSGALSGTANPATLTIAGDLAATASFVPRLADVTRPGDPIIATSDNLNPSRGAAAAIDNELDLSYINIKDPLGVGFTVTPSVGPTVVSGLGLTSSGDGPDADPASYRLEGSHDGQTFALIASGAVPPFLTRFEQQNLFFTNAIAYETYRLVFPTFAGAVGPNMEIGEVQLFGTAAVSPPRISMAYANGTLTLSWDPAAQDFILETTPSLKPPVAWTQVPTTTLNRIDIPVTEAARFYRLTQ